MDTESHCACDCCNERFLATISAMRPALAFAAAVAVEQGVGATAMKQTAASAATRNASRSFRSMAGAGPARRWMPVQASSPGSCQWLPKYSGKFRRGRKAGQGKIGYFTRPIQGNGAVSVRQQIGRTGANKAAPNWPFRGDIMRTIALILAQPGAGSGAGRGDGQRRLPLKSRSFRSNWRIFSAGAGYVPP
jgi:hypothetical protein